MQHINLADNAALAQFALARQRTTEEAMKQLKEASDTPDAFVMLSLQNDSAILILLAAFFASRAELDQRRMMQSPIHIPGRG